VSHALRLGLLLTLLLATGAEADEAQLERGREVFLASGCLGCHTDEDNGGPALAGGRAIASDFGTFYTPNITPDPETGIGSWSEADFVRAMQQGVAPDGTHYYPAFPYTAYTRMRRPDVVALWVFLKRQPPVKRANREHDLPFYMSWLPSARVWKARYFTAGEYRDDPGQSIEWNRGAYLVEAMGHCAECHTPRLALGVLDQARAYAGVQDLGGESVPNITPHRKTGIGRWSVDDLVYFLRTGTTLDGDSTGGKMAGIIDDGLRHLPESDLHAMAVYLKSLPAIDNPIGRKKVKGKKEEWE